MGGLMRAHDWSVTPLGRPERWPQSLRSAVSIMLNSRFPIALYWGESLALLYNDAWSPIPGAKHPWALGRPGREVWPEIWDAIGPLYARVLSTGEGVWQEDELLPMRRHGYVEECYFNFTFSPVRGEDGGIDGIFNAVVETTDRVLAERRLRTLGRMSERPNPDLSAESACRRAAAILADNKPDAPFVLIYLRDGEEAHLVAAEGVAPGSAVAPASIVLTDANDAPWPLDGVDRHNAFDVATIPAALGLRGPVWPEPVVQASVTPIGAAGETRPSAFLVVGVNPRRALDTAYRSFVHAAADHVANALATARAYAEERRRAEALAEIDRVKTMFFSNISHEFRTPLTLMLGPIEDALSDGEALAPSQRERLELAQRNAMRLLRLANSLLDFSRVEAGRADARFRATDLAALTADLASSFRAATDKAGLRLVIDAPPLSRPVYVDRDMWEKIVLNLLSNAFKFTFAGEIVVALHEAGERVELTVRDTGTGIPAAALPKLFERFGRVEGVQGRSFEGSGIGLALVRDLIKQHGGGIEVRSDVGRGTAFTVTLPLGTAHLPPERLVVDSPVVDDASLRTQPIVDEALRWSLDEPAESPAPDGPAADRTGAGRRVLLADDNADLRLYIARLLGAHGYRVETASDGEAALRNLRATRPDLLVTDVMMPKLDGFGLLRAVRDDPGLRDLPVIMLSARAGEEAKVEGLDRGADDYLVKPFAARELLARVSATIEMARVRREAAEALAATEARAARVLAGMSECYLLLDREFRIVEINEAGLRVDGRDRDAIVGRSHWEVWPGSESTRQGALYQRVMAERTAGGIENPYTWPDGRRQWFEVNAHPVPDGVAIFYRDVTERKGAEAALQHLNETLERRVEAAIAERDRTWNNARDLLLVLSADGVFRAVNPAWTAILGWSADELVGRCYLDLIHPDDHPASRDALATATRANLPAFENRYRHRDGTFRWISWVAAPEGDLIYASGRDVTAERERLEALAAAEAARLQTYDLYRAYFDNTAEALFIVNVSEDGAFTIADLNPAHQTSVGLPLAEVQGKRIEDVLPAGLAGQVADRYRSVIASGAVAQYRETLQIQGEPTHWDTVLVPVRDAGGRIVRLVGSSRDLTRQQAAEEQLRQSQKMEAMGQLTGGVAHDFNNLLTPIVGSLDMLLRNGVGGAREQRLIASAAQSAERARTLVQRLLAFARRQPLQATAVDVARLVTGMADLIGSTSGPRIRVVVDAAPDLPAADADANQLEMAILNLSVNARDAMPEGGTLTITAREVEVAPGQGTGPRPGRYIRLSVADTGSGMDEVTLARAIEPFFSTKGIGQGTGLGLSMVHGLATQLGGALTIESRRGLGTTVQLWLSVSADAAGTTAAASQATPQALSTGMVLLVDDEDLVRMSTADMLGELGYEVVEAGSGEEALRLIGDGLRPKLVVTDHLMPGMNGTDLARRILSEHASLPVLLISGYAETTGVAPDLPRLNKPFRSDELAASLAQIAALA